MLECIAADRCFTEAAYHTNDAMVETFASGHFVAAISRVTVRLTPPQAELQAAQIFEFPVRWAFVT